VFSLVDARGKLRSSRLTQLRSRIEIIASVLNEATEGTKKTRIMYQCNLSHRQLQAYLRLLVGMEMLKIIPEGGSGTSKLFKTSDKGHEFIAAYRKLKALMPQSPCP